MERQVIGQPARRSDGLHVPRPPQPRVARGSDRLEQRPRQQSQTDAAFDAGLTPGPRLRHCTGPLGNIEVGLDRPAVGIGASDLVGGQLPRGGADQQRPLVGRVIHPHDIDQGPGGLAEVPVAPAAHAHLTGLKANRRIFVRAAFGALRARRQHGPLQRGATAFAGALGGGGTAQRDVPAQAPDQRIVRSGGAKLLAGGNAPHPH